MGKQPKMRPKFSGEGSPSEVSNNGIRKIKLNRSQLESLRVSIDKGIPYETALAKAINISVEELQSTNWVIDHSSFSEAT